MGGVDFNHLKPGLKGPARRVGKSPDDFPQLGLSQGGGLGIALREGLCVGTDDGPAALTRGHLTAPLGPGAVGARFSPRVGELNARRRAVLAQKNG